MAQFLKTNTTAAGPVSLTAGVTRNYRKASIFACKGLDGPTASPNTGTVYLGFSAGAGEQPMEMQPGDERTFGNEQGMLDLAGIFLKVATDGDGVVVVYH